MNYYFKNNCCKTVFVTKTVSLEIQDNILVATLPNTPIEIKNKDMIKFTICQDIPTDTTSENVLSILINGVDIFVLDRFGNFVRGDQLRKGVTYYMVVSTSPIVGVITSRNLCKTTFEFPTIPVEEIECLKKKKDKTPKITPKKVEEVVENA